MNGQVIQFDDSAHRAADALLPWLVNGTLTGAELASVEQHVRECARCRREIDLLVQLRAACAIEDPAVDPSPALRRLRARTRTRWTRVLGGRAVGFLRHWPQAPAWARWTMAVELVGIVALAGWMVVPGSESETPYRTLGAPAPRVAQPDTIAVVFAPEVSESELRRIVRVAGARVVDGPTESNAYVLQATAGHRDAMLAALRSEPAVVLAAPLTAPAQR